MLRVKVFVNNREIDEIQLVNTGHVNKEGQHLYRFRKPDILDHLEIYHLRTNPWTMLVEEALVAYNDYLRDVAER